MPQTLLALLAMIIASLVSFNQKHNALTTYQAMLDNEIEMAASGTLMHVMELIGGRSFDERSTPEGIRAVGTLPASELEFSLKARFGTFDRGTQGCNLESAYLTPACDDVDDVNGLRNVPVYARFLDGRQLEFFVDVDVVYVVDRLVQTESLTPTRHKRVTVTVRSPYLPPSGIVLQRVHSYDPIKAEMDYEVVHGPLGT